MVMDNAANPGGGSSGAVGSEAGQGAADGSGGSAAGAGGASTGPAGVVDELDELWPSRRPSTAALRLAEAWVANPETSHQWMYGLGGVDLDPEVWDVRINFDGVGNIERTIGRDDVTFMHIVALMETEGYGIMDSIYCRKGEGMELVENNGKNYELLDYFQSTKVLNLTVKRGMPVVQKAKPAAARSLISYADPVVYDLSPPPIGLLTRAR